MKDSYRPDIDGLRAISILLVVLFHSNVSFLGGGFVGVDVFFVISGFLITSIIRSELGRGTFSLATFYERRIRRLFPALVVVLFTSTLAAFWLLEPFLLKVFGKDLGAASVFMSNFLFARNLGYFSGSGRPLLHLWSLSVEEQFYIIFPLIMIILSTRPRKWMLPCLYALGAVSLGASVWMTVAASTQAFYLPVSRAWELLFGALIAVNGIPKPSPRVARAAPLVGLGAILLASVAFSPSTPFPGLAALLPCFGAVLVIWPGGATAPAMLRSKQMVFLGLISYPLYLWHWPVLVFARYALLREPTHSETAALVLLSFALACGTWRFIELPVRRWIDGRLRQRLVIFSASAAVLAVGAGAGATAYLTHGLPGREPVTIATLRPWENREPERDILYRARSCFLVLDQTTADYQDDLCYGIDPDLLVWGDSFSAHLYPGLAKHHQLRVAQASMGFCPPILDLEVRFRSGCPEFTKHVLEKIRSRPPRDVILSADWMLVPDSDLGSLHETIAQVQLLGSNVVVVGPTPIFGVSASQAYFRLASGDVNPAFAKAIDDAHTSERVRKFALEAGATYIDPKGTMCKPQSICRIRDGEELLYFDAGHLTLRGSEFFAKMIMSSLLLRNQVRAPQNSSSAPYPLLP